VVWANRLSTWLAFWTTPLLLLVLKRLARAALAHQQAREKLLDDLESRNSELERFAYAVSHDLKSPLVTIKGFLGMLERSASSGDLQTLRADIARIGAAADRMRQLLDGLLELSRIGRAVDATDVPLDEVVKEALDALNGPIADARATIRVSSPLPAVRGDRLRIRQIFQNLIENAVKFSAKSPTPSIEVTARRTNDGVHACVKDNGIGVDPRSAERIFGLFEQIDKKIPGTGVGLALVKRAVEVQGGRVWVESDGAGSGSAFSFTLPASSREQTIQGTTTEDQNRADAISPTPG
jgi:signal transduction histidine kinase